MTEANTTGGADDFLTLRVSRCEWIADQIRLFELRQPDGGPLPEFSAGAHLTVRVPSGVLRKYSLCNDPVETDRYVFAVKRDAAGRGGSLSLVDATTVGDLLPVRAPQNAFALSERANQFIFIAGGIGITPIMSMLRHLESTGRTRFRLYYLTRSPADTAFLAELSAPAFQGRVKIHHDYGDPERGFDLWPVLENPTSAHVYCCGPRSLMDTVRDMSGHWPPSAIHFESFLDAGALARPDDVPFTVRLARSGQVVAVPVGRSILEVLREAGCRVASSCEAGTCGTCKVALLAGEPDHRDLVLTDAERATHVMVCVSRARSDELVLDL